MKNQTSRNLAVLLAVSVTFALTGCASNLSQRAQHADGLGAITADVLGHGHRDVAKVEITPSPTARILTAHAVEKGDGARVYGTLQPIVRLSRGAGAHVHVLMVGQDGKTIAQASATYLVPAHSLRLHGGLRAPARFTTMLPRPAPGSSFRVLHHGVSAAHCPGV